MSEISRFTPFSLPVYGVNPVRLTPVIDISQYCLCQPLCVNMCVYSVVFCLYKWEYGNKALFHTRKAPVMLYEKVFVIILAA